jgi:O-antigen/teichoic acid export membrane protein
LAKVQKNLLYNLLLSLSQIIFPLFTIPYIARVLSPNSIGQVSFADSFAFYFTIIAEFGIMTYGVREIARYKTDMVQLNKTVSSLLSLHILTSFLAIFIFSCFAFIFRTHFQDPNILILSYLYLFANAFACEWYFYGQEAFNYIAIRSILVRISGIIAIYLLVQSPDDYLWYYGIIVFTSVLTISLNFYQIIRKRLFRFNFKAGLTHIKHIWTINLISILYSIPLLLDNVVLGIVASATSVGLYAFTVKIVRISGSVVTDSLLVFFPSVVSLKSRNDHDQLKQQLLFSMRLILLFATPLSIGIFLLADEIIPVFLGENFTNVIPSLQILALYPIIKSITLYYSNPVLIANQHEKSYFKNVIVSSLVFFGLAIAGGYYYGVTGMCVALLITETVLLVLNLLSVKKHVPDLPVFCTRTFFIALLSSLFFYPVSYAVSLLHLPAIPDLTIKIISCILFYLVIVFVVVKPLGPLSMQKR